MHSAYTECSFCLLLLFIISDTTNSTVLNVCTTCCIPKHTCQVEKPKCFFKCLSNVTNKPTFSDGDLNNISHPIPLHTEYGDPMSAVYPHPYFNYFNGTNVYCDSKYYGKESLVNKCNALLFHSMNYFCMIHISICSATNAIQMIFVLLMFWVDLCVLCMFILCKRLSKNLLYIKGMAIYYVNWLLKKSISIYGSMYKVKK